MAASFEIAEGHLEVTADTSKADRALDGFFRGADGRLRDSRGKFAKAGEDAGEAFGDGLTKGTRRFFGGGKGGGGFFSSIFSGLSDFMKGGIGQARQFGQMMQDLGNAVQGIGGVVGSILKIVGLAAAIPVIIALGAALAQLLGLLLVMPAAVATLIAIFAPLMIAIKGVAGAVAAFASGDMAKFNEELKKLGPNARAATREITGLIAPMRELKKYVTEQFWGPMVGAIKPLATTLLPTLRTGLGDVANSLGNFGRGLAELFASNDINEAIGDVFETAGRIIDRMSPSLINFIGTMIGLIERGLPYVERFFGWVAQGVDKLNGMLSGSMQSGKFEEWINKGIDVLKDLWDLAKEVGGLLAAIFGNDEAAEGGRGIIQSLTEMTKGFKEFFQSSDGKEMISNLMDVVGAIGWVIRHIDDLYIAIWKTWNAIREFGRDTAAFFVDAWNWVKGAGAAIKDWFVGAGEWFANLGRKIGELATSVWGWITGAGAALIAWVQALPGAVMEFITSIPERLRAAFWQMFDAVNYGIGYTLGFLLSLGPRIWEIIQSMWATVVNITKSSWDRFLAFWHAIPPFLAGIWDSVRTNTVNAINAIGAWLDQLPGRAWNAVVSLGTGLRDGFVNAWAWARNATVQGRDAVLRFFEELPGRIRGIFAGAGSWLFGLGQDIWRGLGDGIRSMIDWAVGVAKRAAGSVVQGFKDGFWSKSPSKRMRKEVGHTLLPGMMLGVKDDLPKAMQQLTGITDKLTGSAAQSVVNVAPPAVSVGGSTTVVMLDGRQIATHMAQEYPEQVAAGTAEGSRRRRFTNTARPATV